MPAGARRADGPRPDIVAAFAAAALAGGVVGPADRRVENLRAVRLLTDAPIIGLIKRELRDSPVRITPLVAEISPVRRTAA